MMNGERVPIMCRHVVHRDCLEKKCKKLSQNTFDPAVNDNTKIDANGITMLMQEIDFSRRVH